MESGGNVHRGMEQSGNAGIHLTGKPLVDHLKGRHPAPDDPFLAGEIVLGNFIRLKPDIRLRFDLPGGKPLKKAVDFVLG